MLGLMGLLIANFLRVTCPVKQIAVVETGHSHLLEAHPTLNRLEWTLALHFQAHSH